MVDIFLQLNLWDTAGMERAGSMTGGYYTSSNAIVMVYDASEPSTLTSCVSWKDEAKRYAKPEPVYFLAGNKCDKIHDIEVDERTAYNFAEKHNIPRENVFRISAKSGKGVNEMFLSILSKLSTSPKPYDKIDHVVPTFEDAYREDNKEKKGCSC